MIIQEIVTGNYQKLFLSFLFQVHQKWTSLPS